MADFEFIGTGWSFPPTFNDLTGSVEMVSGKTDIEQSLHILLTTALGERVMQPTYGAGMEPLLFEPLNASLAALMEKTIRQAILDHEPRVRLEQVRLDVQAEEGLVLIDIQYVIPSVNTRNNFVFPFYLEEGTEL